jgi:hypothetical protein
MNCKIYTLELENGKYYVGKTHNVEKRYAQHQKGGCLWTKMHKPIKILNVIDGDAFDEDKVTKQMMSKYGIDNVRGGSYVLPKLTAFQHKFLLAELKMINDLCIKCGNPGHFMKDCQKLKCERCYRLGHSIEECYAKTDVLGAELIPVGKPKYMPIEDHEEEDDEELIESEKLITTEERKRYLKPVGALGDLSAVMVTERNKIMIWDPQDCARCKRNHKFRECYATVDSSGYELLPVGRERECLRCGTTIYTTRMCDCPIKGIKGFIRYVGDIINSVAAPDERCDRCNRKNHCINECSEYRDSKNRMIGNSIKSCSICGKKSYLIACHYSE